MQKLNARDYPNLPDTFLHDLKQELAGWAVDPVSGPMPEAFDRDYPQEITRPVPCVGETFWTVPAPPGGTPRIVAQWAYTMPSGATKRVEVAVPEEIRAIMAVSPAPSGDEMVTAVYNSTLAIVQAMLRADWGVPG